MQSEVVEAVEDAIDREERRQGKALMDGDFVGEQIFAQWNPGNLMLVELHNARVRGGDAEVSMAIQIITDWNMARWVEQGEKDEVPASVQASVLVGNACVLSCCGEVQMAAAALDMAMAAHQQACQEAGIEVAVLTRRPRPNRTAPTPLEN